MTRLSAPAEALRDHARLCAHCAEVARAGKPPRALCAVGRLLAEAAIRMATRTLRAS